MATLGNTTATKLTVLNDVTATSFVGPLTGNATSATKATQDASGNTITTTYAKQTDAYKASYNSTNHCLELSTLK